VVFPKQMTPVMGRSRRTLYASTSRDFAHWSKLAPALVADRRDDLGVLPRLRATAPLLQYPVNPNVTRSEFYGTGACAAECGLVAFPWLLTVSANVPPPAGNQDGPVEVQLAMSRDLETWARPLRAAALPPAGDAKAWDAGMVFTASQAIDVGDEVWLYYCGTNYTHGAALADPRYKCAIGLATWKRDRFVSADAGPGGGTLTTVPVRFDGSHLEINAAATAPGGSVIVEILDEGGAKLADLPASETFAGDALRHAVRFAGKDGAGGVDLKPWAGKPVVLRFRLRDAQLFSFAFRR
jgi:hypothetical protein